MKKLFYILVLIFAPCYLLAYTETFYVCEGGNGTLPKTDACATAWDGEDFSTAGNWAFAKAVDNKIGQDDVVYFKDDGGSIRAEILIRESGTASDYITFMNYPGDSPKIVQSEIVGDNGDFQWTVLDSANRIFQADVSSVHSQTYQILNYDNSDRSPKYSSVPAYSSWEDEYFHGGDGSTWLGKYRLKCDAACPGDNDSQRLAALNAQDREVGWRDSAVDFKGEDYLIWDGIDIDGPGGSFTSDNNDMWAKPLYSSGSHHIIIRNSTIRFGIQAIMMASCGNLGGDPPDYAGDWLIEDVEIKRSLVGIQSWMCNDTIIRRTHITEIGNKPGDAGDRAFVGTQYSDDGLIEDCYFADRGLEGDTSSFNLDRGISIVNGSEGWIVRRNYVKDSAIGGIIFGAVGQCVQDGSTPCPDDYGNYQVYNNTFENYSIANRSPSGTPTYKQFNGITVGGGASSAFKQMGYVYIYNNLFLNSGDDQTVDLDNDATQNNSAAIYLVGVNDYTDLRVNNNIMMNNIKTDGNLYEMYISYNSATYREVENNLFYNPGGSPGDEIILWGGSTTESVDDFNTNHTWASGNVEINPQLKANNTLSGSSPAVAVTGGVVISDAEVRKAVHPGRIWTPFASMTDTIITRTSTYSIGPYEYSRRRMIIVQ